MLRYKICVIGAYAVGKSSLVARFTQGIFSEEYLTTLGVKIDRKVLHVEGREVRVVVWDMAGEDEFAKVNVAYLQGANGYLLVVDGTRDGTLNVARMLERKVRETIGPLPFVVLANKCDLEEQWEVRRGEFRAMASEGWTVMKTSAKTGEGVDEAFLALARKFLGEPGPEKKGL